MIHKLKIEDNYLEHLLEGTKKAEIRLNDRDYQTGDVLEFHHHLFGTDWEKVYFIVTHIHSGLGLQQNYIVMSVKKTKEPK